MNTLLLVAALGLSAPPAGALHCPEPVAAKGDVKGGPVLVHTFELTHRGVGTLTITRADPSCGCLHRTLTKTVLQPGDTAKLTLEVNTLTQPNGPNRWSVIVGYTVDGPGVPAEAGELALQVRATLSREVMVSPPQLALSVTAGETPTAGVAGPRTYTITVVDVRAKPLTVIKATPTSPHLSAEVGARTVAAGGGMQQNVTLKLAPDTPTGQFDETLVMTTDDLAYAELRVPIRIEKRMAGGLIVAPEAIAVRFASVPVEIATLVQVRRGDGKPVTIAGVECDQPKVGLKWSMGASAVAAVRITVPESLAAESGKCTVRVKLSEPMGQDVVIPVQWQGVKR